MMSNPYRWDLDGLSGAIPRDYGGLQTHVLAGRAVRFVGGRGMGKTVTLRQLEARLQGETGVRVLRIEQPPIDATTVGRYVADVARRLRVSNVTSMNEVIEQLGADLLVLLLDEFDQYLAVDGGRVARDWLNHLEGVRRDTAGRLAVVVAGGIGLLHLGHVLGSGLVSRAETVLAQPFSGDEVAALARSLRDRRRFDDEALQLLLAASGGNPALVTYGLQRLWDSDIEADASRIIEGVFGEFVDRHAAFVRSVEDAVSRQGSVTAPARVLEVIRSHADGVPRAALQAACGGEQPRIDVAQAVEILRAAGLVRLHGSLASETVDVVAIGSVITLTGSSSGPGSGDVVADLIADVVAVLGELHRYSLDFRARGEGVVEEKVFSGVLAIALAMRGWRCSRELRQAAGELDLRVDLRSSDPAAHVVIETKIWPRNDYRGVQAQIESYAVDETRHLVVVMVRDGRREEEDWVLEYQDHCLAGRTYETLARPTNLVGHWRTQGTRPVTDHLLLRIAQR
jgi:hypothetical protein